MTGWRQTRTSTQKFPRRATRVPIRIATVDPEIDPDTGDAFFRATEATTANLSRGGVFVHSWEPLSSGRRVIVTLDLPAGGELQLVGRVVWTRRQLTAQGAGPVEAPGYGIEFVERSRAEQAAIQQILDATTAAEATAPSAPRAASTVSAESPPSTTQPAPGIASTASAAESTASSHASAGSSTAGSTSTPAAQPKTRRAFPPVA